MVDDPPASEWDPDAYDRDTGFVHESGGSVVEIFGVDSA
jgi:hypothetical protein